jgi:hypothetical protein
MLHHEVVELQGFKDNRVGGVRDSLINDVTPKRTSIEHTIDKTARGVY